MPSDTPHQKVEKWRQAWLKDCGQHNLTVTESILLAAIKPHKAGPYGGSVDIVDSGRTPPSGDLTGTSPESIQVMLVCLQ